MIESHDCLVNAPAVGPTGLLLTNSNIYLAANGKVKTGEDIADSLVEVANKSIVEDNG